MSSQGVSKSNSFNGTECVCCQSVYSLQLFGGLLSLSLSAQLWLLHALRVCLGHVRIQLRVQVALGLGHVSIKLVVQLLACDDGTACSSASAASTTPSCKPSTTSQTPAA